MSYENNNNSFMDCYATMEDGILTIGNSCMERLWDVSGPVPAVVSLKNKITLKEWVAGEAEKKWPLQEKRDAFRNTGILAKPNAEYRMNVLIDDDYGYSERFLKVEVSICGSVT